MTRRIQTEFRFSFYGQGTVSIDRGDTTYMCGQADVRKLFGEMLGDRVAGEYKNAGIIHKENCKKCWLPRQPFAAVAVKESIQTRKDWKLDGVT